MTKSMARSSIFLVKPSNIMMKSIASSEYTRLFLACKLFETNDEGEFAAAIVLWSKEDVATDGLRTSLSHKRIRSSADMRPGAYIQ
jgi:hypothetical protein